MPNHRKGLLLLLYFLPNLPDPAAATTFDVWDWNYQAILYFSGSVIISDLNFCFALFPFLAKDDDLLKLAFSSRGTYL
jgi:hypothetical protein